MVSVIIPLYNRANLISHTLNSLNQFRQPTIDIDVVVVDDCSTDGGCELVQTNFQWVKLICNESNMGAPFCRNLGLKFAKGKYVHFLDSDDLVEMNFYLHKIERLEREGDLAGVYGPWVYFESDHEFQNQFVRPRHAMYPLYDTSSNKQIVINLLGGWFIPIHAVIWRTTMVREAGGFNCNLQINQDVDFCFRMLLRNVIVGIDSPRALIRIHNGERIGKVASEEKLGQILELRMAFIEALKNLNSSVTVYQKAVAQYSFGLWGEYRKIYPSTADKFLAFSKESDPHLKVSGSLPFRLLAAFCGNANAVKIKQWFKG